MKGNFQSSGERANESLREFHVNEQTAPAKWLVNDAVATASTGLAAGQILHCGAKAPTTRCAGRSARYAGSETHPDRYSVLAAD